MREKCPNTEFFLVHIFLCSDWVGYLRIQSEYSKLRTRNNSVFGHFSRSALFSKCLHKSSQVLRRAIMGKYSRSSTAI